VVVAVAEPSDPEIAAAVTLALSEDPYTKGVPWKVAVNDGVVALAGEVESAFLARWAEETVSVVPGVDRVINQITVAETPRRPTDRVLQDRIDRQLAYNTLVDARRVVVRVEDGVAVLSGLVDSLEARRLVALTAADEDVRCVIERLHIRPRAPVYREPPPPLEPCPRPPLAE
jgi:osmotically-inducible protein OsmY